MIAESKQKYFLDRVHKMYYIHLTIIGTFGRADVPQRLINQSLYQEIQLLQKFNEIGGKVLKQEKKISSPISEKK